MPSTGRARTEARTARPTNTQANTQATAECGAHPELAEGSGQRRVFTEKSRRKAAPGGLVPMGPESRLGRACPHSIPSPRRVPGASAPGDSDG